MLMTTFLNLFIEHVGYLDAYLQNFYIISNIIWSIGDVDLVSQQNFILSISM